MFKRSALILVAIALLSGPAPASESIPIGNTIDLQTCLKLAFDSHPSLKVADAELEAARARLDQAKAGYKPGVEWNTSFSHGDPSPGSGYDKLSSGVSVSQTITDFGRTRGTVAVSRLKTSASEADLTDERASLIYAVKQAYWGLIKAREDQAAYAAEVERLERHRDQARAFYTVGTKPKIELTKAEVELNQARLDRLKAGGNLRLARLRLTNAMGLAAGDFEPSGAEALPSAACARAASLEQAYASRADLKALEARQAAAERQVKVKLGEYYPSLKATAGYEWSGEDFPLDHEWNTGLNLSFALYDATTRGAVREARAELAGLKAEVDLKRQTIRLEVESAIISLNESREQVSLAELGLRQARENRELAQGRYASGVGTALEVTDALSSELEARRELSAATYEYRLAAASLAKATGADQ